MNKNVKREQKQRRGEPRAREKHGVPRGRDVSWNTADRRAPSIAVPSELERRKHECVRTKKAQREKTNYATVGALCVLFSSPV